MTISAGEWKCKIRPADGSHYQEGTINLLTSEQGFVRDMRLPHHVIPQTYNLSLTPFIIPDNYTIQGSITINAVTQEAENKCDSKVGEIKTTTTEKNFFLYLKPLQIKSRYDQKLTWL
jgi:hypothetical protein